MIPEKALKKGVAYGLPDCMEDFLRTAQDVQLFFSKHIRPDGSIKPEGILSLLKANRVNVTALAELHGYSEAYFRQVIKRECKDPKVENIIAEKLHGFEVNRIWGRRVLCEVANAC